VSQHGLIVNPKHRLDRTGRHCCCAVCERRANVVVVERHDLPELRLALCESHGGPELRRARDRCRKRHDRRVAVYG
jgi:hypothetical protein